MKDLIQAQKMIYPDLLEVMQKRYTILYTISLFEPIGRRGIVEQTKFPERFIRKEIELLQNQNLVQMTTKGMFITEIGKDMVSNLHQFNRELSGISHLEKQLMQKIGIERVIVVPGDCDQHEFIKQELGRATVLFLKTIVDRNVTIAVTGGTTMAAVAEAMVPFEKYECVFVPARGGIGEKVENQANTIVARMAKAEKGNYHLLHVPDPLSELLYQSLIKESSIADTLNIIKSANFVIHG